MGNISNEPRGSAVYPGVRSVCVRCANVTFYVFVLWIGRVAAQTPAILYPGVAPAPPSLRNLHPAASQASPSISVAVSVDWRFKYYVYVNMYFHDKLTQNQTYSSCWLIMRVSVVDNICKHFSVSVKRIGKSLDPGKYTLDYNYLGLGYYL